MALIKQAIAELDKNGLWEYRLPGLAASEEKLVAVEKLLGEPLDPSYRRFLAHAGGWLAFLQTVDLFGADDLLGGSRAAHAAELLGDIETSALAKADLRREDLLPIAASPVDLDLFVLTGRSARRSGMVVWFAGYEIDRFPNFDEYFLAMMDYNRLELDHFRSKASA